MARDLIDLCGGLLEDQFGADWHFYVVPNGKPYEAPDPLYWFNLLKGTTSPAYDALGARPGQLDLQLHRMRQIRNELFHFAFDYKVLRTQQHLGQLRDLAHRCRLPCKADIDDGSTAAGTPACGKGHSSAHCTGSAPGPCSHRETRA